MKLFSKILLFVLVFASSSAYAQTLKFGHIDVNELISLMPERDSAVVKLEKLAAELGENLKGLENELQSKFATYQQKQATWTAAILEAKQKELQDIQARLQEFQQTAQQNYSQVQQQLFAPIYQKAKEVIEKIGKDQSFVYIFDTSSGNIAYIGESSVNVLPIAKSELGIPADKKPMMPKQEAQPAVQ